ncbi:MAG: hypothetical protein ACXWQO_11230 [Bdellovibrionota bacterium]
MVFLRKHMMRGYAFAYLGLALFTLAGCTSTTRMLLTTDLPHNQTNYKKVQVYFQEPPHKSRPLALIAVARDGENATWAVEILKMEAAVLGADALANVEVTYTTGFVPNLRVQGLAVKYVE